jgi:hypothetical protein
MAGKRYNVGAVCVCVCVCNARRESAMVAATTSQSHTRAQRNDGAQRRMMNRRRDVRHIGRECRVSDVRGNDDRSEMT